MDEITCEMSPKASRGLRACRSTLLIFNSETCHPLCCISFRFVWIEIEIYGFWCVYVCERGEGFKLGSYERSNIGSIKLTIQQFLITHKVSMIITIYAYLCFKNIIIKKISMNPLQYPPPPAVNITLLHVFAYSKVEVTSLRDSCLYQVGRWLPN